MSHNKNLGKNGEDIACDYLLKHGYKIIARNYRCRYGEIDIIAKHDDDLVFIEVKTRTNDYISAVFAVDKKKQEHIINTALYFIDDKNFEDENIRFDVVTIESNKIALIKNAFMVYNEE